MDEKQERHEDVGALYRRYRTPVRRLMQAASAFLFILCAFCPLDNVTQLRTIALGLLAASFII